MTSDIDRLAELAGIENGYWDISGTWHVTSEDTKRSLLETMGLEVGSPTAIEESMGRLRAAGAGEETSASPKARCVLPADLGFERIWGAACQVYGLRSARNSGIGDFEDVARLSERLARQGADFLGLSPLHSLFPTDPQRFSPYAPSSRRRLNTLMIALDQACIELDVDLPDLPDLERLRRVELIDYAEVARVKQAAFEDLWKVFWTAHLAPGNESPLGRAYRAWRVEEGAELETFCRFEAISEHLAAEAGKSPPWWEWPAEFRSPDSRAIESFANEREERVAFFAFLQWLADRQLSAAHARARNAGMRVGLYRDLAVGVTPDGADVWAEPTAVIRGASIGAPPDSFSPTGQNWNVAPLSPLALREQNFKAFLADLRANMRHAGAVRIDHVMGLMRLFWIPAGGTPADGAYVRYPFARMLEQVARQSQREGCLVVGEDLGTVPEGFTPTMNEAGILSCRVLWFQRHWDTGGQFKAPQEYEPLALASVSTHDLATIPGFLAAHDVDWRLKVGQYADADRAAAERDRRREEVARLIEALRGEALITENPDDAAVAVALHHFLARSRSALAVVQLEDLAGEIEQANLPGTIDEHPNWRRRVPFPLQEPASLPLARRILDAMRKERPK